MADHVSDGIYRQFQMFYQSHNVSMTRSFSNDLITAKSIYKLQKLKNKHWNDKGNVKKTIGRKCKRGHEKLMCEKVLVSISIKSSVHMLTFVTFAQV